MQHIVVAFGVEFILLQRHLCSERGCVWFVVVGALWLRIARLCGRSLLLLPVLLLLQHLTLMCTFILVIFLNGVNHVIHQL